MRYNEMLYMWSTLHEEDIFSRVELNEKINMELLKSYIYKECAEMTTITNNELVFEQMLVNTFKLWKDNIDRIVNVLTTDYDPFSDYYKKYDETKDKGGEDEKHHDGANSNDSSTVEHKDKSINTSGDSKYFHSSYNMGDNESVLTDREENNTSQSNNEDGTNTFKENGKNNFDENGKFKENVKLNGKITGLYNHTFQELEDMEIEHASFNIYKWILDKVVIKNLFLWLY